ncbi:hypothetical protein C8F04DRAFT_421131 [Mycena alexandri]|uniref:Uncharacterized protein n=1 Tax=Mycena alexandri TaxID=1745969 RepID=A0AAD6T3N6_9AGAR|nr:hypothetical protein C8F04DRAFT_421131 [Mycena alexandri]
MGRGLRFYWTNRTHDDTKVDPTFQSSNPAERKTEDLVSLGLGAGARSNLCNLLYPNCSTRFRRRVRLEPTIASSPYQSRFRLLFLLVVLIRLFSRLWFGAGSKPLSSPCVRDVGVVGIVGPVFQEEVQWRRRRDGCRKEAGMWRCCRINADFDDIAFFLLATNWHLQPTCSWRP